MDIILETERLIIRPLEATDAPGMYLMDSDPEVQKYVGKKPVSTVQQIEEVIAMVQGQYAQFGIGRWAVIEKVSGEFAGWTGFKYMEGPVNGHEGFYDFGYRFARRFWGRGFATEAGKATLAYGLRELKLKDIFAMTDCDNAASRNVLHKLGFIYQATFEWHSEPNWREAGEPTTWYKYMDEAAR